MINSSLPAVCLRPVEQRGHECLELVQVPAVQGERDPPVQLQLHDLEHAGWRRGNIGQRGCLPAPTIQHPHDRQRPCLLHFHPAHSPDHHQPDKPALSEALGKEGSRGRAPFSSPSVLATSGSLEQSAE